MNYEQAKEGLEKTGITEYSHHVYDAGSGGFEVVPKMINKILITPEFKWSEVYSYMQSHRCDNETALKNLGLIENVNLTVLLFSNFGENDSRYITLEGYLSLPPVL